MLCRAGRVSLWQKWLAVNMDTAVRAELAPCSEPASLAQPNMEHCAAWQSPGWEKFHAYFEDLSSTNTASQS